MINSDQQLIWEAYNRQINRIQFLNEMSTGSYDDIVLMYEAGFFKNIGNKLKKGAQLGAIGAAGLSSALGPTAKANTNDMSSAEDTWNKTERMYNIQQDKDDKTFKKHVRTMQKNTDKIDQLDVSPDSANEFSSLKKGEELEDEWTGFVDRLIDGYSRAVQRYHSGKYRKGMSLDDIANIYKNFKKYEKAIEYYTKVLNKLEKNSDTYADVLYRRGGSYERLKNYSKADEDLLLSLDIRSDDAYTLNYLAYSWLERNIKIEEAMKMLMTAYEQKENDPYITDSVGWGYYLIGDFINAEKYLRRAVELMPDDPIVNDHYGDVLWQLNRKLQAKYFWLHVLELDDAEDEMKRSIEIKLIDGPKKI